jgi:hypothetical protein
MDALQIMGRGESIARKLVAALKAGAIHRVDIEVIEEACDAEITLDVAGRELLVNTVTRRVVEMV